MEISEIRLGGYERVARCRDEASGLHALIAVHDTTLGPALGGMRMLPYVSEDEALFDVLRLARGMTDKSAVAETGLGGGKAVILGDPRRSKSPELFRAMGRFIDSFDGSYITAEDMNICVEDLEAVNTSTRWVTGLSRESGSSGDPSPYTARGCFQGMRAVLTELYGNAAFSGRMVVMQGVGAVGGRLAAMLSEAGARVMICDIDDGRIQALTSEYPIEVVDDDHHLDVECDIYAPCARGAGINDETVPRLRCRAVAGCANNVLLETRHADLLRERDILYAPDFVINAGGIINISCELRPTGYDETTAISRVDRIHDNLSQVFEISRNEALSTSEAALRLAARRLEEGRAAPASQV